MTLDERKAAADRCVRMFDLRYWLSGLGCCWLCSLRLAIAQVEAENGFAFQAPDTRCADPTRDCRSRARAAWKAMPARPNQPGVKAA